MEGNSNQSSIACATELPGREEELRKKTKSKSETEEEAKACEIDPRDDKARREFLGGCSSVLVRKECM